MLLGNLGSFEDLSVDLKLIILQTVLQNNFFTVITCPKLSNETHDWGYVDTSGVSLIPEMVIHVYRLGKTYGI